MLPWSTGPLTLLENVAKVPDHQVAKMGKLCIFDLTSSFFFSISVSQASTIMAEAITNAKKQLGIVRTTYRDLRSQTILQ